MSSPAATGIVSRLHKQSTATVEIAAATASRKQRLLGGVFSPQGNGLATFTLQSASTVIAGPFELAAKTPLVLPEANAGWADTVAGEALNMVVTAGEVVADVVVQAVK